MTTIIFISSCLTCVVPCFHMSPQKTIVICEHTPKTKYNSAVINTKFKGKEKVFHELQILNCQTSSCKSDRVGRTSWCSSA
jgi:hypothetical protein